MHTTIAGVLSLLIGQAAPGPSVEVATLGQGSWRLSTTIEGSADPAAGQAVLMPKAAALCGSETPVFGRYRFASSEQVGSSPAAGETATLTFSAELSCRAGGAPAPPSGPGVVSISAADSDRLSPVIAAMTEGYLALLDDGKDAEAYAMTSPEMHGGQSLEAWVAGRAELRAVRGPFASRNVARVSFYPNPDGVEPGLYAAVDYVAAYGRSEQCGYVVWFSPTGKEPFVVVRQETTNLSRDLDPAHRLAMRQAHCVIV